MADYSIGDIYQGGYSSFNPEHSLFTGYRGSIETLGVSTDPRTGNILKEFTDKLAPGQKVVELSLITPEVLEAIPKQHLQEINRLSKLTGVEPTIHGPLLDASGITQDRTFDETNRQIVERKLLQTLERSHDVNPDGNIPVTFHTANQLPGARWGKISEEERKMRRISDTEEKLMMPIVNRESGQVNIVKKQEKYNPTAFEGMPVQKEIYDVNKQLRVMNNTEWEENLQKLIIPKEHADRILNETAPLVLPIREKLVNKEIRLENLEKKQAETFLNYNSRFENAHQQLEDIQTHLNSIFDKAYKTYENEKNERGIKYLNEIAKEFTAGTTIKKNGNLYSVQDPTVHSKAIQKFMENLRPEMLRENKVDVPKVYIAAEEYAIEKSQETFGNTAWNLYQKAKKEKWKGIPIINIENPPAGFGLSRAEDLKNMVKGSREKFVQNATKNGISKREAEKQAEQMIGVTWDVGHINQLRQFGYSSKDIIKEAEKVAPYVKHIHLSDNFGMENTELPMGMGNVDLKEVMEKLKAGGVDVDNTRKIVEAAHWWMHHQSSPIGVSMEALGSPLYSMKMGPSWDRTLGYHQGYFGGYGAFLPQTNYEMFGAGFSQLPGELGGQRQGGQGGRMSGRPME